MLCPVCHHPNADGMPYCTQCHEPFEKPSSANAPRPVPERKNAPPEPWRSSPTISVTAPPLPKFRERVRSQIRQWNIPRSWWVGGLVALAVVFLLLFGLPSFPLFGLRLEYRFPSKTQIAFLTGSKLKLTQWSESDGRLDTPLPEIQVDEPATVWISHKRKEQLVVTPKEWMRVEHTGKKASSMMIPVDHPSTHALTIPLENHGVVREHPRNAAQRTGRMAVFVFPKFPSARLHQAQRWTETVTWRENIGAWRILWRGVFTWEVMAYEKYLGRQSVRLRYTAQLTPTVDEAAPWASSLDGVPFFEGHGEGLAFYDVNDHQVISNAFLLTGHLQIPISDLSRIPKAQRVGRARAMRGKAGRLHLQFESGTDIRKL